MEDFNSKYSGEQVEALLDQVASGNAGGGGGGISAESDPIFSASPAAGITDDNIQTWNSKQDAIADLQAIREGASKGATALQEHQTLKTINGESVVGEGDITIAGGTGEKGDKGDTGVGIQSVTQTTTSDADGGSNVVTVTLTDGTTSTFIVKNGSKGSQGEQGIQGIQGEKGDAGVDGTNGKDGADGEDGATFTPSVDSAGNLSWTNNKGLANPPTVNIKGPKGDAGEGGGSSSGGGKTVIEAPISATGGIVFLRENPMQPNTIYVATEAITEGVAIRAIEPPTSFAAEYVLHLYLEDTGPSPLTVPDTVIWANGETPADIDVGVHYELSIMASKVGNEYIYKAVLTPFKTAE